MDLAQVSRIGASPDSCQTPASRHDLKAGEAPGPSGYAPPVVKRPSDEWQRKVDEEATEAARGARAPTDVHAAVLWPESLRSGTDAALASFEAELAALKTSTDAAVLAAVESLVLALNKINEQHVNAGLMGYETDERDELCDYITESLRRFGIDVKGLEQRNGADPGDIAGRWRDW